MFDFSRSQSFQKLQKLSVNPPDLTTDLTPKRIEEMKLGAVGFKFLFAAERVDQIVMDALYELALEAKALEKMQLMQSGAIVNKSENRSVLHTAMRDQFSDRQTDPAAKQASEMAAKELDKLERFLGEIEGKFTDLVQIGIGGSDLGPRALSIALQAYQRPNHRVHFISNVDPDDAYEVLSKLDLKRTLIVVVSKSGTTLETLTNEELVRAKMVQMGLDPKEHFIAVTGEKSPMDDPKRYLASFYMWDFIGGRYSATSMVGGVVLGFSLGFQGFKEILRGAHEMDLHALKAPAEKNLPLTSALLGIWNRNFLHHQTVAIIPYSQALVRFPAHLQQLDMESNGKQIDKYAKPVDFQTGPVVWGEPGTNGQHSFYQLIHQGTDVIPLEFIGFSESQYGEDLVVKGTNSQQKLLANLFAQSIALAVGQDNSDPNKIFLGNRPNRILLGKKLDPFTMGALLSFYEHKVAFQGFIWNINSFDQEGVQLGKTLATKVLELFKKSGDFALGEAYLKHLSD
jgi:glucose-6-phosphate isomerase